ncbi:MAG: hypothetical protein JXR73_01180 [Candidatus Omnitrophica bacterium]|nr:hypothetical protein [Candidatus Omnitrophota bacterium]
MTCFSSRQFYVFVLIGAVQSFAFAQGESILVDFNAATPVGNQISLQDVNFGPVPSAEISFGAVPTDNDFPNATDGIGAIVDADPGEGIMIFGPPSNAPGGAIIRCSVYAESANGAIHVAGIDQTENIFVSQNIPNNVAFFLGRWRRHLNIAVPGSASLLPLIQVYNPSQTESLRVYLDNFEIIPLESGRFYNADILSGAEYDPEVISIDENPQPATPTAIPTTPAPTPTRPAGNPTPTATPQPSGSAVGLRLTACDPTGPASLEGTMQFDGIPVIVDLIDAQGRIVNPGVEGGDAERTVTLSVSGSALIDGIAPTQQTTIISPQGGRVNIVDFTPEEVLLTAEAEGLNSTPPLPLRFEEAGAISGTVFVWNGQSYAAPEITDTITVTVYKSGAAESDDYVKSETLSFSSGAYTIGGLPAGSYNVQFTGQRLNFDIPDIPEIPEIPDIPDIPGFPSIPGLSVSMLSAKASPMQDYNDLLIPLETVCVSNVAVSAGQTVQGVDANLGLVDNPARLHGMIIPESYTPGNFVQVMLQPIGDACAGSTRLASVDTSSGSYEITNIQAGAYLVIAYEFDADGNLVEKNDENMQISFAPGEDKELNIPLKLLIPITPIAPANYQRLPLAKLTFEWTVPPGTPHLNYLLMVMDRCGELVYQEENIYYSQDGNSIRADITSRNFLVSVNDPEKTIFSWYVSGVDSDGSITADMQYSNASDTNFLVDQ